METIASLFIAHQGKCSDKWENYLDIYEAEFARFRQRTAPVAMLEIGVQDGGSLEIWQKAMPAGSRITGIDVDPRVASLRYAPGIEVLVGDGTDPSALQAMLRERQFDVVIDDGSHQSRDVIATFEAIFPRLHPGGLYVIEDTACSYWDEYGGGLRRQGASVEWLKRLVDAIHADSWRRAAPDMLDLNLRDTYAAYVERVAFFEGITTVSKRRIPKRSPWRRTMTGGQSSHSGHIGWMATDFPKSPDRFRLGEAFAREVILEISRRQAQAIEPPADPIGPATPPTEP